MVSIANLTATILGRVILGFVTPRIGEKTAVLVNQISPTESCHANKLIGVYPAHHGL
jgi:hypothetical protein